MFEYIVRVNLAIHRSGREIEKENVFRVFSAETDDEARKQAQDFATKSMSRVQAERFGSKGGEAEKVEASGRLDRLSLVQM